MFRVIIAGCRMFGDYQLMKEKCDYFFQNKKPTAIICGDARGADTLGKRYAKERNIPVELFPAEWNKYGNRAGYLRNTQMANNADALIAFWDGKSRGTGNMIEIARKKNLPVRIVYIQLNQTGDD